MRPLIFSCLALSLALFGCALFGGKTAPAEEAGTTTAVSMEVACAHCVYQMEGVTACAPACKIDDKVVLLEGSAVDAQTLMDKGCCKGALMAEAEGKIEGDKFVATSLTVKE